VRSDQTDELVALVDRHRETVVRCSNAIDEQRFHIRLELAKIGFAATRSCHASSESSDSVAPAGPGYIATTFFAGVLWKKNARADGDVQAVPHRVGDDQVAQPADAARHAAGSASPPDR
jgi:hypothetical protein